MVLKNTVAPLIGPAFKRSIAMLLLIVVGCADEEINVISVPIKSTSLNFSESLASGTVELTVTASAAIGADLDTKTSEGENDFSTTKQQSVQQR